MAAWHKGPEPTDRVKIIETNGDIVLVTEGYENCSFVDGISLKINNTKFDDEDTYWCEVQEEYTLKKDEGYLYLNVTEPLQDPVEPQIEKLDLDPAVAIENEVIAIKCNSTGLPPPTYSWLLNDLPLPDEERYQLSESDSKMTIRNVEGPTKCSMATMQKRFNCIWNFLQDGDEMTIICETEGGNPLPTFTWFNGSHEIQGEYFVEPECDLDCTAINKYTWTLRKYDNGITCTCEGHHQETQSQGECQIAQKSPFVVTVQCLTPSNKEGDFVLIICKSMDGNPSATLVWFNETDQQELIKISPKPEESGSIKLEYDWEITRADNQGEFRCEATNIVQSSPLLCTYGPLNVQYAPKIQEQENDKTVVVYEAEDAELVCNMTSNPSADIVWLDKTKEPILNETNSRIIQETTQDTLIQSVLILHDVSRKDSGIYTCVANNSMVELLWR
ncbi:limbic system-associated membrane protein-like [Ptychodera flava]|uniref:limbic system-associated membrane protein-like n=1 Tax=Ptychodera flava TaxID=63121 RepID=UPI00396A2314